ncbi:S-dihydroxybenzoyltransferase [Arthrobotrys entomopaga]|nr:S-dihydroxybenzoyltransferase [Arthrobotrys entomopaga]
MADGNSHGLPALPLFTVANEHATRRPGQAAVIDVKLSKSFTYSELLAGAARVRSLILEALGCDSPDIQEQRVAFLVPSGIEYVRIQWGIWAAGGVAVPLCVTHPFQELEYVIRDSQSSLVFLHEDFSHHKSDLSASFPSLRILEGPFHHQIAETEATQSQWPIPFSPTVELSRRALIIYTSGTTSKPKGCVSTHENIYFQASSLVKAWEYSHSDHLLHILPLHHIHGIINGLTATLLAGGTVELHRKFDPSIIWKRWMDGDSTLFMAVPTVYSRLTSHFTENIAGTENEDRAVAGAKNLRLVVSGSDALPVSIKQRFNEITGQVILERYGMTEIGMALSCRYHDEDGFGRPNGTVGWPLDNIEVRIVDEKGDIVSSHMDSGEIQIKGANVFKEYWQRPEATAKEFTEDGFFKTGDIAWRNSSGAFTIQGRKSVDIIKSGGYKISALDVEREILARIPGVKEVAVVGVKDLEWGERVAAILVMQQGYEHLELIDFRNLLRRHLAPYKIPTLIKVVEAIERNAMGKVNKKELVKSLWSNS